MGWIFHAGVLILIFMLLRFYEIVNTSIYILQGYSRQNLPLVQKLRFDFTPRYYLILTFWEISISNCQLIKFRLTFFALFDIGLLRYWYQMKILNFERKSKCSHRGMNTRGKNWLLWKGLTVCCLICVLCHNFWTNYDLDLFSTSKWPSELQFCERYLSM